MQLPTILSPLLLCFCLQSMVAQTMLIGTVQDDKEPLIGAFINITKQGQFGRGTITDAEGKYRIMLDAGIYEVSCSYTGYATKQITGVQVLNNEVTVLDIRLEPNATLQEVVVIAYKVPLIKQDQTSSGQVLTSEQIISIKGSRSAAVGVIPSKANKAKRNAPAKPSAIAAEKAKTKIDKRQQRQLRDSLSREGNRAQYNPIVENPFQESAQNSVSTFSIDVDGAAYANIRRYIQSGSLPPTDAVRIEEMVNYFDYAYPQPKGQHPFDLNAEVGPCPWTPSHRLLRIGLQGSTMDPGQLPPANLVFLVDVSGSMASDDKLPLVQQSLRLLTDQLRPIDRVALVVYAGAAGLVLESTPGTEKDSIKNTIDKLSAGGSTAGGAGIQLAYATARKHFLPNGNNRVILCTDGDFNVGISTEKELVHFIEGERESGVYLTVLGFGTGNYQDGMMQSLADKGNGNHAYVDRLDEARKIFVREFGGTLFAIAKDVKLQLHFNPKQVAAYRLIGYENRLLATEDFHDDRKDAGELGAGHRVTALYELILNKQDQVPPTKQATALTLVENPAQSVTPQADELLVFQLRYKKPKGRGPSTLLEYRLNASALEQKAESPSFLLASAIAEFGLLLRGSHFKGEASYANALANAKAAGSIKGDVYVTELAGLIEKAGKMAEGGR